MDSIHVPDVSPDGSYAEEAPRVGFAGYGVWFGPLHPQNLSAPLSGPEQTNNRAELTACIEALRVVLFPEPLHIVADSVCTIGKLHICIAGQCRVGVCLTKTSGIPCIPCCAPDPRGRMCIDTWGSWGTRGLMPLRTWAGSNTRTSCGFLGIFLRVMANVPWSWPHRCLVSKLQNEIN